MPTTEPHRTPEELARLGAEVFDRPVRPALRPEDDGKFVAIDIGTGDQASDEDDCRKSGRTLQVCLTARPTCERRSRSR